MDCPNFAACPFPELQSNVSNELWKVLYCFENSLNGYEECARFKYKEKFDKKPPAELLPNM